MSKVMVSMFHGHGEEDPSKCRVNSRRGNLFNKGMKTMKMQNRQNHIGESGEQHSQRDAEVGG